MILKKALQEILRVSVSLFFIAASIYFLRDKWVHSFRILKEIHLQMFGIVCVIFILINAIVGFRLYEVLRIQELRIPFHRVIYFTFVGLFFNLFLPSSIGGDVVKAYYLSKDSGSKMQTISAVVVDRLLGLGAVVFVALITLPFFMRFYSDSKLVGTVLVIGLGFIFGTVFFLSESLAKRFKFLKHLIPSELGKQKVSEFYHSIANSRRHFSKLFSCFVISLLIQAAAILMGFILARSIGINISLMVFMLVLPATSIIAMVPSFGGLGVREASIIYFLSIYSSPEAATAFALGYDILIYGFGLFCGILFIILNKTMERKGVKEE